MGRRVAQGGPAEWNTPIWEHDLQRGLRILRHAIDTHLITSHHLLPLLIAEPGGLLVEVTDGTTSSNESRYRLSVLYDLAKVSVNRLGFSQGHELASRAATAEAITPGRLRSEMMLDNFGVSEANWRDALDPARADNNDQPVAALASDPNRTRWNQRSINSGQLAHEYGFTDVDGSQPDIWRFIEQTREPGHDTTSTTTGESSRPRRHHHPWFMAG